ncbi:SDR family NAD(P)-dependent oxidoreductase [Francisellaceae bacterium]|nr:SDR family NAD(P)-dependent oxidoreductase [Francisellaceae bacterium]
MKTVTGKKIWIIGASAGIGEALVKQLDEQGAMLAISARSEEGLYNLGKSLTKKPLIYPLDVTNEANITRSFKALIAAWDEVDSIIYMPAMYNPMKLERLELPLVRSELEANLMAVFNAISVITPVLKKQKRGQFLICSSVAGFVGLPKSQPYSCTKAAVTNLTETLKCEYPFLDIKVIHPGFVKTRLTDKNNFKMPMIITPEKAADYIYKGMLKSKFEIAFPGRFIFMIKLLRLLPYRLYFKILAR